MGMIAYLKSKKMKRCGNCGAEIWGESDVCPKCGLTVGQSDPHQEQY